MTMGSIVPDSLKNHAVLFIEHWLIHQIDIGSLGCDIYWHTPNLISIDRKKSRSNPHVYIGKILRDDECATTIRVRYPLQASLKDQVFDMKDPEFFEWLTERIMLGITDYQPN